MFVVDHEHACVALKAAESFLKTSQCTYFTGKSGLRDVKRADFIWYWRRSGLKNLDKPKTFIRKAKEIVHTTSFIRFW